MSNQGAILFLDIDDVLCMNRSYGGFDVIDAVHQRHDAPEKVFAEVFDKAACAALETVHQAMEGRLRYVVSSTWREHLDREQLVQVFLKGGLGFVASALHDAWCTPHQSHRGLRVDEIAAWLDRFYQGQPFAIVDDLYSGSSLEPALANRSHPFHHRVVLCEEGIGLLHEHVQPLLQALSQPISGINDISGTNDINSINGSTHEVQPGALDDQGAQRTEGAQ